MLEPLLSPASWMEMVSFENATLAAMLRIAYDEPPVVGWTQKMAQMYNNAQIKAETYWWLWKYLKKNVLKLLKTNDYFWI